MVFGKGKVGSARRCAGALGGTQSWFDFSGIFLTLNSFNEADYTFRLMGTFKKREEKTKKKQLYSLGLKSVKDIGTEKATQIKKEFEKLVLVFTQMRYYQDIIDVEEKKRNL